MKSTAATLCSALVISIAAAAPTAARAYETPVHAEITARAFIQALQHRDFLVDLGIVHFFRDGTLHMEGFAGRTPFDWSVRGSMLEDNNVRSAFHFFDPLAPATRQGLKGVFQSTPDWALDVNTNPTYSIPGTRNSLYNALTNTDPIVRPRLWRDMFRGLGQFTHLLQDMSQPQHVRDDDHFSLTEQFYYLFPDYSRYEKHTLQLLGQGGLLFDGYPLVKMPDYLSFWVTADNKGLAQFANLNFVSEHTNLDDTKYASPGPGTLLKEEVIPQVLDVLGRPIQGATDVTIQYVSNTFADAYANRTITNNRLSTYSIFDFQRLAMANKRVYSLYNTNHKAYADILLPMAVGYSAGLMSHFLRGSMSISPPDENIYGIVDHSTFTDKQTDPFGFSGFDTIKLKVRNATANGETMAGGTLQAVAKFRRNTCYKDDLSGEFTSLNPPCALYRTEDEEIVVSNTFTGVTLTSTPQPLTFTFQKHIPINATDLFLQVVYRGPLGDREPDAVVVGTRDLFEPNYFAIANSSDYILFNGSFLKRDDPALIPTLDKLPVDGKLDAFWDQTDMDVYFGFTPAFTAAPLATVTALPPGRYARVAILTDRSPYPAPVQAQGFTYFSSFVYSVTAGKNQLEAELDTYRVSIYAPLRGVNMFSSLWLYREFGTPTSGNLSTMGSFANLKPFPLTTLTFKPAP